MQSAKELANQILQDISEINPYTAANKHLAFVWATGFLARCVAEMIWRDSDNQYVYRRVRERARDLKRETPLLNPGKDSAKNH